MKYWPLSVIASSPLMPASYGYRLAQIRWQPPTEAAYHACFEVAKHTEPTPMQGLVFIESTDAGIKQAYSSIPIGDAWSRLERAGVVHADDTFYLVLDSLH